MNWQLRPILVAEDNDDDYFLLSRAFQKTNLTNPVFRVKNGHEVILYLSGAHSYADRIAYPFPYVMLLDLKMPVKHGFDVLEWVRTSAAHAKLLPILVLSSSQQDVDVQKAYELGANGYVSKSTSVQDLADVVAAVQTYWLKVNCVVR